MLTHRTDPAFQLPKQQLIAEFRSSFKDIGYTLHPGGIDGEAAGKSSNLAWAIRQAHNELKDEGDEERLGKIVCTVIDSDSESLHRAQKDASPDSL